MRTYTLALALALWACDDGGEDSGPLDGGRTTDGGAADAVTGAGGNAGTGGNAGAGGAAGQAGGGGQAGAGGEAGQGGQAGQGGEAGQGGQGGAPDCDGFELTAEVVEPRPVTRSDAVEIRFSANRDDYQVRFRSDQGGRFTPRDGAVFWAAGGPDDEDAVERPWWTGPVNVEVTAVADGCEASDTVTITLVGDVLMSDGERGGIFIFGSGGRYLGRFAQLLEARGLGTMLALPESAGGELLVVIGPASGEGPTRIRRLSRTGEQLGDYEFTDLAGLPLWADNRLPTRLYFWGDRNEILADNADRSRIVRFNARGEYLGHLGVPGQDPPNHRVIGFGVVDGRPIAGNDINDRAYYLDTDPPELISDVGDGFDTMRSLTPGHNDWLVALAQRGGNEWRLYAYDARGDERARAFLPAFNHHDIIPFMGGYLTLSLNGITRRDATLQPMGEADSWDGPVNVQVGTRTAIVWLN